MCGCLGRCISRVVPGCYWLVTLVVVSWVVTFITNFCLAFFWNFLSSLIRESQTGLWVQFAKEYSRYKNWTVPEEISEY